MKGSHMALIRWEPAREIESLQQEVNRLFGSFFDVQAGRGQATSTRRWVPAMDLLETDGHYVLRADLPGVKPEDVKVELDDDVLTVSGQRHSAHESEGEGVRRIERASGTFTRSLTLPAGVDADRIEASFDQGVLEVRVPKPEQQKPRRVSVQVGGAAPVIEGAASGDAAQDTAERS